MIYYWLKEDSLSQRMKLYAEMRQYTEFKKNQTNFIPSWPSTISLSVTFRSPSSPPPPPEPTIRSPTGNLYTPVTRLLGD